MLVGGELPRGPGAFYPPTVLAGVEEVNPYSRHYLNRLSDLMFVLARVLAVGDRGEVFWDPKRER